MRYSEDALTLDDLVGLHHGDKVVCVDFRDDGVHREDMVSKYDGEIVTIKDASLGGIQIVEFEDDMHYVPRCFRFLIDDKDAVDVDMSVMTEIFQ